MNIHYIDIIIVGAYLVTCLAIGLIKFDKVKTLRDYTLGVKPFSNVLLFSTIFATSIGLYNTVGVVEKSYSLGLVFIIPLIVSPILWLVMSKLLAPNVKLFKQQGFMTLSDMMGYWYGKKAKWISVICIICLELAATSASILAIGYLFSHFLGISPVYGAIASAIVITAYSALGGVQSVAYTDLFQMLIFFVALPVMCAIGLGKAGGIEHVFHSLPTTHLKIDSSNMVLFLSFILYALLPVTGIPYIQRALIAKDETQLTRTFIYTGVCNLFFLICMGLIGLTAYTLNPHINPDTALYYFMGSYLYPGILGIAIAGLLAVIMSTQDSFLNAVSTIIARDVFKQIWPDLTDKSQLTIARISCIVMISVATVISFFKESIVEILWMADNFWDPLITIPLIAGLLGIRIIRKDFIPLVVTSVIAVVCIYIITGTFDTKSHSVGILTSMVGLYIARQRFKAAHPEAEPSKIPEILAGLKKAATTSVFNLGAVYIFSIITLVNLIVSVFILPSRQDVVAIHVGSIILCVLLIFNGLWSNKIRRLLVQKFWYVTLTFCLPLASSYPLFISKFSAPLVVNFVLSLTLLYVLVNPIAFLMTTAIGSALSYTITLTLQPYFTSDLSAHTFGLYSCFFTTIGILIQIYNKKYVSREVHTELARVLEEKVDERTKDLQDALAAKKEFLGKVSHEVRTPLQGIISTSQILYEDWKNIAEPERYKLAGLVAHSGDRLMELMNNILDLSKFSAGKIDVVFKENVDISKLIDNAVKIGATFAEGLNKDVTFSVEIDDAVRKNIECDDTRITQVLINLINNAVKYSDGGEIIIRAAHRSEGKLKLSVSDNGVGIPQEELTAIFEAFTQSTRTKDPSKGKGLGLAICREIIGSHHGQIWAENNKDKPGSTFSFIIPYEQGVSQAKAIESEKSSSLKPQHSIGRVLLVDDEEICLQGGSMCLKAIGFEVVTADGGVPALQYLKEHPGEIDLILLDLMMPDMYGLNVLKALKADQNLKHIPVIIQSGLLDPNEIGKALEAGAIGHLPKPYNKDIIHGVISKALTQKEEIAA